MSEVVPIQVKLHQKSRSLEIHLDDETSYE